MKTPPMNYLIVELLTLSYPLFLLSKNIYSIVMIMILIIHSHTFQKYFNEIDKNLKKNLKIFVLYILLTFGLFQTKNYIFFGLLFGILQYYTYFIHNGYQWIEMWKDIPMTLISSYIAYQGYKTNNLLLAPFLGDFVYHILEYVNHS